MDRNKEYSDSVILFVITNNNLNPYNPELLCYHDEWVWYVIFLKICRCYLSQFMIVVEYDSEMCFSLAAVFENEVIW